MTSPACRGDGVGVGSDAVDPRVLIITQPEDPTADLVVEELNRRGVRLLRFDTGDFPLRSSLQTTISDIDRRWRGTLRVDGRVVRWESVQSIYYRRPSFFQFDERLSEPERAFAEAQARHAISGLLSAIEDAHWVNKPGAMADARVKPIQLARAARRGFTIPETLITNIAARASEFVRTHPRAVTKPLAASSITENATRAVAYTSEVDIDAHALGTDATVGTTAHLFQELVPGNDVRLTMVGERAFAVRIEPNDPDGPVDIRAHHEQVSYHLVDVPEHVRRRCRALLDDFDLTFGAFDFRITASGWTFLELNPNGQWAFVPELRSPIATALADALEGINP